MPAIVRNSSSQPLVLVFEDAEFRFSPQDERELTDAQLASDEFKRNEVYFTVSPLTPEVPLEEAPLKTSVKGK